MTHAWTTPVTPADLAGLFRGDIARWKDLDVTAEQFIESCVEHGMAGLVSQLLAGHPTSRTWPRAIYAGLAERARTDIAAELLRRREIMAVLDQLAAEGIHPILLKGTPLAYQIYESPHLRPRSDTDLFIPHGQKDLVRQTLSRLEYRAALCCDGELLFRQFELQRIDEFGVEHAFDFHWSISTQSLFSDLLSYGELAAGAVAVPALGPHARAAGSLHALLLACVHPVMHHRNRERLIWVFDVHQLASRLSAIDFCHFANLAIEKQVATICAHSLRWAHARFGTKIPDRVLPRLEASSKPEPTAVYLRSGRAWTDELWSNVCGLPRWIDRLRLLVEILFPSPSYMLRAYGLPPRVKGTVQLPALYLYRGISGLAKVLAGQK